MTCQILKDDPFGAVAEFSHCGSSRFRVDDRSVRVDAFDAIPAGGGLIDRDSFVGRDVWWEVEFDAAVTDANRVASRETVCARHVGTGFVGAEQCNRVLGCRRREQRENINLALLHRLRMAEHRCKIEFFGNIATVNDDSQVVRHSGRWAVAQQCVRSD